MKKFVTKQQIIHGRSIVKVGATVELDENAVSTKALLETGHIEPAGSEDKTADGKGKK